MSMDISMTTPAVNTKKVDWRNYDYSEGPPKTTTAVTTRDTNPYSQRVDYPLTRRTLSNTTDLTTRTNNTAENRSRLNSNNASVGLGNCKSFDGLGSNSNNNTDRSRLNSNNLLGVGNSRSFDSGLSSHAYSLRGDSNVNVNVGMPSTATHTTTGIGKTEAPTSTPTPTTTTLTTPTTVTTPTTLKDEKFIMKNYRNKLTTINRKINTNSIGKNISGSSSLTYRPAKITPKPVVDMEPDEEDEIMRIPKVKKYAENLDEENVALAEDLSEERITGMKKTMTHSPDMMDEQEPNTVSPMNNQLGGIGGRPKAFEKVWEEAEKDWEKAAISNVRMVSDDEEEQQYNPNDENNHGVMDCVSDDNYNNAEDGTGTRRQKETYKYTKFDDFAGDRSESKINADNDNSSEASAGKMDVGKIDVPINLAPVGILKNTGRFDSFTKSCAASITSIGSNSMGSRKKSIENAGSDNNQVSREASSIKDINVNDTIPNSAPEPAAHGNTNEKAEEEEDDDTIFQFEKLDAKKKYRRRRPRNRGGIIEEEDDDTSIDDNGRSPTKKRADTLKDRTKQAWSVRNRATAASVGNSVAVTERRERVSFQNGATIREFTPDSGQDDSTILEESDDDTEYTEYTETSQDYDDDTYAGRSMQSYYSKSNESEAEDMIKDFLLIGRGKATCPGRRQLKYKKGMKEEYEKQELEQIRDDSFSTISTAGTKEKKIGAGDDAVSMFYNICEDGMQAIGDVCGLFSTVDKNVNEKKQSEEVEISTEDWFENTSKTVFYADHEIKPDDLCGSSVASLPEDNGKDALLKMALNAARLKHSLRNLKYDETQSMNVTNDIKIVELSVGIPIGVGFEESEYGCAVKKIFKNGNTFNNSIGDRIQIGDHLASIDGTTAFSKGITDLCKILANCPNPEEIQLFLLRYIGPTRASNANEQQGYEVIDPHVEKPKDWPKDELTPVKLHKSLASVGCIKAALKKPSNINSDQDAKQDVDQDVDEGVKQDTNQDANQDAEKENLPLSTSKENEGIKSQNPNDDQGDKQKRAKGRGKKKKGFGFFRRRKEGVIKGIVSQPKSPSK